jgi:hypothetical protein
LLGHQAGLAVDRALQERQARHRAGDVDGVAGDLLGAFGWVEGGGDESAAVADRRGAGIEQADERTDVLGFPCLFEGPDDGGLPGCRGRGRLRGADAAAR